MKKFFLGLTLSGLLAVTASATTISTTVSSGDVSAGSGFTAILPQFLSMPLLPSLGAGQVFILNWWSVDLDSQTKSNTARFENLGLTPDTINATISVNVTSNGGSVPAAPAPGFLAANSVIIFPSFNATAFDGNIDWAGGSGIQITPPQQLGPIVSDGTGMILNLTGVDGFGSFSLDFLSNNNSVITGGNLAAQVSTVYASDVTLTFDYDILCIDQDLCGGGGNEVPEPTTMALMGIGLVGLGFIGRRLRK